MSVRKPVVAIVGRQNVGKSTLFNRLAGKPLAIVDDSPGTTRDRILASVSYPGGEFIMVDTGGLELNPDSAMAKEVNEQVATAIKEADVIILLLDSSDGIIPADLEIADSLRKIGKPVILVANKADNAKYESRVVEFYQLGLGEPLAISAYHGRGITELVDRIIRLLPVPSSVESEPEAPEAIKVAIVGRPNVGKSTLLNTILGSERSIVDDIPGTTRDAIDTLVDLDGVSVLLIDTGGIRRRGQIKGGVERYSVIRALRAIDRADIVLLVLDATELVTAQDMHIAGYIRQACKGMILLVNKWDRIEAGSTADFSHHVKGYFKFVDYAPVLHTSARLGWGVDKIMPQLLEIYQERLKRLPTAVVNSTIQRAVAAHSLPRKGNLRLKVLYVTQAEVNPPTFVFFVNDPHLIHFSYQRYLENRLRQSFGFVGTPIRFVFKARGV